MCFFYHDKNYALLPRGFFQAIAQCIAAAGCLFQALHQKELMRAAKFGNSFLQVSNILLYCIENFVRLDLDPASTKNAELKSRHNLPMCSFYCFIVINS
jgi:hypothetical protein